MVLKKFNFKYKGKKYEVEVKECKSILQKTSGLMFRKNSLALLFVYKRLVREPIHSFFCIPFIAIWFDGDKVVDVQFVKGWKLNIKPKQKFDKFLEIPENSEIFPEILDGKENI